jgi:hypothetical protein
MVLFAATPYARETVPALGVSASLVFGLPPQMLMTFYQSERLQRDQGLTVSNTQRRN